MRRRRPIVVVLAAMAMLVVSQAMPVTANTPIRFGSKLDNTFDTTGPVSCDGTTVCTWIMNQPFNSTKLTAPKDGTIHKLRVVAGAADTVKVVLARANGSLQGKVVRKGATIHPVGLDSTSNKVEVFNVSIAGQEGRPAGHQRRHVAHRALLRRQAEYSPVLTDAAARWIRLPTSSTTPAAG